MLEYNIINLFIIQRDWPFYSIEHSMCDFYDVTVVVSVNHFLINSTSSLFVFTVFILYDFDDRPKIILKHDSSTQAHFEF